MTSLTFLSFLFFKKELFFFHIVLWYNNLKLGKSENEFVVVIVCNFFWFLVFFGRRRNRNSSVGYINIKINLLLRVWFLSRNFYLIFILLWLWPFSIFTSTSKYSIHLKLITRLTRLQRKYYLLRMKYWYFIFIYVLKCTSTVHFYLSTILNSSLLTYQ